MLCARKMHGAPAHLLLACGGPEIQSVCSLLVDEMACQAVASRMAGSRRYPCSNRVQVGTRERPISGHSAQIKPLKRRRLSNASIACF